jgi:5-methylthioadenosine/S-adenosylhomocysteine deaminase
LGHGRAPLSSFLDASVTVGLGSDSVASNNTCDLIEEARFAFLLARNPSLTASQMLALAIQDGMLREGHQADLVVVGLDGAHQVPVYDPVTALVFSSSGRDVLLTIIAGREVYRDQRVAGVDERRLRARMNEIAQKL